MPPPQHIEMAATAAPGKFIFTITNDKGRLSKEEIDRMANETKKYKGKIWLVFILPTIY
jgi:hypothetical protein